MSHFLFGLRVEGASPTPIVRNAVIQRKRNGVGVTATPTPTPNPTFTPTLPPRGLGNLACWVRCQVRSLVGCRVGLYDNTHPIVSPLFKGFPCDWVGCYPHHSPPKLGGVRGGLNRCLCVLHGTPDFKWRYTDKQS